MTEPQPPSPEPPSPQPPAATPSLRLPATARLKSTREFSRVYQRGLRAAGTWMTVVALRNPRTRGARLGVSVSKDHGAAVRRNKIKRLLREAFRHERPQLPSDLDLVLIPRVRDGKLALAELRTELRALVARIGRGQGQKPRPRRES